ncbi:unnamed protein product [Nippostrongylus brasiliensis]|uniref:Activator of basal transcription 1 n=1 Tax=Nippostrongylus brasiliensis TaxID=27835 RepID=A0A0N4Y6H0_NIPBR|nr:hypothetical protein Q1695_008996 [Nippostrongylus brasiliensis]VDL75269.1 unnamed protein product [Nippostrongylus brasiliensis]
MCEDAGISKDGEEEMQDDGEDHRSEGGSSHAQCLDDDEMDNPESKQRKSGVLYFSRIPPKFTPARLQEYFEKHAPGMIGRVYCTRNKNSKTIENRYSEGWLEVKRKKVAKALAARFDNSPVGGKKRDYTASVLWNIKYLSSFKWVHLVEQLQYERTISMHRMSAEIAQARRVAAHFEEQIDKGRHLKRLEEKALKAGGLWNKFQREIEQRKVVKPKRKKNKKKQSNSSAADDDVLKMIFAE